MRRRGDGAGLDCIVLKVAALCNLNCSYCYVYNHQDTTFRERPRFISTEVFDATLARIEAYCTRRPGQRMTIAFHGGEPTLIGPARFDALAARARQKLGRRLKGLSLQTNGTLIDAEWTRVLSRHHVNVGVSIDGPAAVHDAVRVDHAGRGSHRAVVAGLRLLQQAGLDPSVICVIDPGRSGLAVYRHFRRLGIERMNFLLPDVSHDSKALFYGGRGATPVADYLLPVFDAWYEEDDPDVEVRIFRGLIRMLLGGEGETDAFGNLKTGYLVVETDGSIETLDAMRVCAHGLNRSGLTVLEHGFDDLQAGLPIVYQAVHTGFPLCATCQVCPERDICGGGYVPHRYARANRFDNPSVWCADILKLLAHIRSRLPAHVLA
jgi:uncharacterized protein